MGPTELNTTYFAKIVSPKLLVVCLAGIVIGVFATPVAYAQPLCQVISPKRFAKLRSFPVNVVVQLSPEANWETFRASLNSKDITFMFKEADNGLQTVIGPKDGLEINVKTRPPHKVNVLKISVNDLESKYYAEFETFFFIEVDELFTLGPEGGTVRSLDGSLCVTVPENALSSSTAMAISQVYGPGGIAPAYQLAPVGVRFHQPVSLAMKYDSKRIPAGVMRDELFLVSGRQFPSRVQDSVVDSISETVSGTITSFSRVFLSYYINIGKKLSDIPFATDFRLPIGDTSNTSYNCGQEYMPPGEDDLGETRGLLRRSSYPDSEEPRIIFNEKDPARAWRVATAFGHKKPVVISSTPHVEAMVNNGEDWIFVGHRKKQHPIPIHAVADGLMIHNGWGYEKGVVLAHQIPGGVFLSVYSHMGEKSHCAVGTVIRKGNVIGRISGRGTDDGYLHFEIVNGSLIRIDDETGEIKVPASWFGEWELAPVYEHYYDPTNFLSNMMGKYRWGFNVIGNDEGWIPGRAGQYDGTGYRVRDGVFSLKEASNRFEIESYPLNLEAESFDSVFVTMRSNASNGQMRVFFATHEDPQYSDDKAVAVEMVGQGEVLEYRAFMEDNPKWKGAIVRVRIAVEIPDGESTEVDFDSIRLGRAYLSRMPDTGQTKCYDDKKEIVCVAPDSSFYGQDADYVTTSPGYEVKVVNSNEVVIDHVTGLMWQREDDGVKRTWSEAVDYCENLNWAGYSDWRLPTKKELLGIMNYGGFGPSIDTSFFPYSHGPEDLYWSGTTLTFLALSAWNMSLWNSEPNIQAKGDLNYVRAVRGRPLEFGYFRDNGDGTVTDITTGLMWQQTETKAMTWEKALDFCGNLNLAGYTDWRLPNIRELSTIVNDSRHEPSIDQAYFPGCRPAHYWSSTTNALYPAFAWYVGFDDGRTHGGGEKGRRQYVRAVRNAE